MMKKNFFILLILIIGITVSCTSDEKDRYGSIYGVVTDSETAEPLRSIGVELYRGYNTLLLKTVTYDDGHFEFDNLEPDEDVYYNLKIVADGYSESTYTVLVEPGRTARADMQATKLNTYMTVTTLEVENPTDNIITFKGTLVEHTSNFWAHECGFIYGQSQTLDKKTGTLIKADMSSTFQCTIDKRELTNGKWYVRAYAKNSKGYEYGQIRMFEVKLVPVVRTIGVTNIETTSATLNGLIVYEGDPKYTEKGFVYSSTFSMPTIDDSDDVTNKVVISGISNEFCANVLNLTKDKQYNVRAYAKCTDGVVYGDVVSFITTDKKYIIIGGLAIQLTDLSSSATLSEADDLCSKSRVGGFDDWRLPTVAELRIMYDNQSKIGGFFKEKYWSDDLYSGYYSIYYYFSFNNGNSGAEYSSNKLRVRAVRTVK